MRFLLILISVLFLFACSKEQGGVAKADPKQLALSTGIKFTRALVEKRFADAHALLGQQATTKYTVQMLETDYLALIAEIAPIKTVHESEAAFLGDWPGRRPRDYGWVYISISGDEDFEAVNVIVSDENGTPKITEIEWGRAD